MAMQETAKMERDNLFAHTNFPIKRSTLKVAQSGVVKRGSLLTEEGALVKATTEQVFAVLAEDVDTSKAAKVAPVYLTGEFNESALTCSTVKVADLKANARKVCIFIEKTI